MDFKGITWDHARGYDPLLPVTEAFCAANPGVRITWDKRSLKDFGDYPVSLLVQRYDFIMIDHPFMAEALEEGLLVGLDGYIGPDFFALLEREAVGRSLESYRVGGQYLGLPVDAAAQVAAANQPVLERLGVRVPATLGEVLALKGKLGGHWMGTAMAATDLFSLFLGLTAQLSGRDYFHPDRGIDPVLGAQAAVLVDRLARASHPDSFEMNPIQLLDAMAGDDTIVYTPYLYGYTNYARKGFRKNLLTFYDAPLLSPEAQVSTQLGGVGISLSRRIPEEHRATAAAFARDLASPEVQRGVYTRANGQPAARSAWMDPDNNALTNGFFQNTLRTLDTAFLRPQVARWNAFQEEESVCLHREIKERRPPREIAEGFNRRYLAICGRGKGAEACGR